MKTYQVKHQASGRVIATRVEWAKSVWRRTVGLMFRQRMGDIDGLLIERTNSVHTCFMNFPMDAVFLSSDYRIVKIIRRMKPWRFTWMYWRASRVLELEGGALPDQVREGDALEVVGV